MSQEFQCGRCGGEVERVLCEHCEDGYSAPGELHEEDPLWYDEDDVEACAVCRGNGGWWRCCNTDEWCEAHPMPGREQWPAGKVEAFEVGGVP